MRLLRPLPLSSRASPNGSSSPGARPPLCNRLLQRPRPIFAPGWQASGLPRMIFLRPCRIRRFERRLRPGLDFPRRRPNRLHRLARRGLLGNRNLHGICRWAGNSTDPPGDAHPLVAGQSGMVENRFDDLLVMATDSLPPKHAAHLEPWDLPRLVPYADEYLAGFAAESYQVDLPAGFRHRPADGRTGQSAQTVCSATSAETTRAHRHHAVRNFPT